MKSETEAGPAGPAVPAQSLLLRTLRFFAGIFTGGPEAKRVRAEYGSRMAEIDRPARTPRSTRTS